MDTYDPKDTANVLHSSRNSAREGHIMTEGPELLPGYFLVQSPKTDTSVSSACREVRCQGWRVLWANSAKGITHARVKACPEPVGAWDSLWYFLAGWPQLRMPEPKTKIEVWGHPRMAWFDSGRPVGGGRHE